MSHKTICLSGDVASNYVRRWRHATTRLERLTVDGASTQLKRSVHVWLRF